MPTLPRPVAARFSGRAAEVAPLVSPELAPADGMYEGNGAHYLSCGASALNAVAAAVALAGAKPGAILDFGSGAGRVTRWLRAAYPAAALSATDLRAGDLAFCEAEFGARTFPSGTDVDALEAPDRYDLVWAGSVLTHLSEGTSERLVERLFSWLRPGGLLVVSLHGRFVLARGPAFGHYGVGPEGWAEVERGYAGRGYGYADYPGQPGYGISACSPAWAVGLAGRVVPGASVALWGERAWDDHQDVLALRDRAVTEAVA